MRLIHSVPFDAQEIEHYRQQVFNNLTQGMLLLLESMVDMHLKLSAENQVYFDMIEHAPELRDGESFPIFFYHPLKTLWADPNVQKAWYRRNEAALPEKYVTFHLRAHLDRYGLIFDQSSVLLLRPRPIIRS